MGRRLCTLPLVPAGCTATITASFEDPPCSQEPSQRGPGDRHPEIWTEARGRLHGLVGGGVRPICLSWVLQSPGSPPATCPRCSDAALTSGDQQPHASHPWHPIRLSHRPTPVPADPANPGNANRRHRLSTTDVQLENGSAESRGGPWVPAQPRGPTALGQGSQPARRTLCPRHPTPGWAAVFTTDP